jgi:hypothetical protein
MVSLEASSMNVGVVTLALICLHFTCISIKTIINHVTHKLHLSDRLFNYDWPDMDYLNLVTPQKSPDLIICEMAWYDNFPSPESKPRPMSPKELVALINDPHEKAGKDYIVVDVRRTDFGVPHFLIHTNGPAKNSQGRHKSSST